MSAEPSTSLAATVADESEEIAIEAGAAAKAAAPSTSTTAEEPTQNGDAVKPGTEAAGEGQADEGEEEKVDPNAFPDDACVTLYLQNLNEKVRIPAGRGQGKLTEFVVMKQTLLNLFKPYRPVSEVTAHKNVRMRGQAFVTFPDVEMANKARKEVEQFPLYGKPMQIKFAKMRSDVAVKKQDGEEKLDEFKKERLLHKRQTRRNNALRRKQADKLKSDDPTASAPGASAAKRQKIQMPDEYLPPNNILFIQNLPLETTQEDLREVFEAHPGLVEIRTIPAKKDIAFVEFADEGAATVAKDALHNFKIDGETKMKVTYARK